jgi:hypothetical protein
MGEYREVPLHDHLIAEGMVSPIVGALSVQNGFCVFSKNAKLRHAKK